MSGLPWYPLYPGDYARDTQQLSLLEHGAYRLLLDHYYSTGSLDCLTKRSSFDGSDDELSIINSRMYRLCRAISDEEKKAVDVILDIFFIFENGKYFNKKVEKVISDQTAKHQKRTDAAKLAVEARELKRKEKQQQNSLTKRSSNDKPNDEPTIIDRSSNQNQNQNQLLDIDKSISNSKVKKFTPPTFEEVKDYAKSRGDKVDSKKFFDYYNEGEWKDAKGNKVKSWKQKLITWEGKQSPTFITKGDEEELQRQQIREFYKNKEETCK